MAKIDNKIFEQKAIIHQVVAEYLVKNRFAWMSPRNNLFIGPVDHQHYQYSRKLPNHIFLTIVEIVMRDYRLSEHTVSWVLEFGEEYTIDAFFKLCHHSKKNSDHGYYDEFRKVVKQWVADHPGIIHRQTESKADVARRLRAELQVDIDTLASKLPAAQANMLRSIVDRTRQYVTEDNNW